MVENGEKIKAGKVLVKIPRRSSKSEILQEVLRITELLEARNPSTQL
jgi:DNA-directed RNA polymerase subunit beta'